MADHYGMGGGPGASSGTPGMGRGMGMGRGIGGGMAAPGAAFPSRDKAPPLSKEQELKALKDQADALRKQIEAVESRIKDSE